MELSDVRNYPKGHNYKKPVYLIAGLKLAKGASVRLEKVTKVTKLLVKAEVSLNNENMRTVQFKEM